jgi:flagellar hook-associated protein 2
MSKVGSTTLKFSGLASGIDTDAALKQILSSDNLRITNTKKDIIYLGWKQTAYKDVANSLKTFKSTYFDALKPETNFNSYSMFKKFSSSVKVDGADSTAVTAQAGANANVGSFEMAVTQLAEADKYVSTNTIKVGANNATPSTKITDLGVSGNSTTPVKFTINKKVFEVNTVDGTYRAYADTAATEADKGAFTKFNTSGTDVTIKNITDMVTNSNAGVNLSFNSLSGKVSLEAKSQGTDSAITYSDNASTLFAALNLGSNNTAGTHAVVAKNAEVYVDGVKHTEQTNTFTTDGVTFTLNKVTATVDGSGNVLTGGKVNIKLSSDVDGIVTNVKKFVDEYNKIIKSLSDQAKEKRAKTADKEYYLPLTSDEEAEMSESQIKLWNEKAKTGLLYNDTDIKEISSNFRSFLYDSVTMDNGSTISLYQIGITTSSDKTKPGQLVVDEKKLRTALEKDPDSVAQLFASTDGISSKMIETIDKAISTSSKNPGSLTLKAGGENTYLDNNFMFSQIKSQNELLARLTDSMESKSDRYSKMFTRLEVAMSKSNSQQSMFSSMK